MAETRKIVSIEDIVKYEGVPVAKLEIRETGEIRPVEEAYLAPFRAYKFQVSATIDGQMDLGSSRVIGLRHILEIGPEHKGHRGYETNHSYLEIQNELLLGQALIALTDYANRHDANIDPQCCTQGNFASHSLMGKFIKCCREWLETLH